MKINPTDIAVIAAISACLLFFGIRGIRMKGRAFQRKDLSVAHYFLSLGELGSGLIGVAYLCFVFFR